MLYMSDIMLGSEIMKKDTSLLPRKCIQLKYSVMSQGIDVCIEQLCSWSPHIIQKLNIKA